VHTLISFICQVCDGTLDALKPLSLKERKAQYDQLAPYLCNLLVVPEHRRKGLGVLLVNACVSEAKNWGYESLCLHVEPTSASAMSLYLREGFIPQRKVGGTLFMKKKIVR
jgi:GNAT superfamily N-acetyltransferase